MTHDKEVLRKLAAQTLASATSPYTTRPEERVVEAMAGYASAFAREQTRKQMEMLSMLRDVLIDHEIKLPTMGKELDALLGDKTYTKWISAQS